MERLLLQRLHLGKSKYGHGVRVNLDTTTWGTPKDSWLEMAKEEFLDGIIYIVCDYIRRGRMNPISTMSKLEIEFNDTSQDDDNDLIMYVVQNVDRMEMNNHREILLCLFNLVNLC